MCVIKRSNQCEKFNLLNDFKRILQFLIFARIEVPKYFTIFLKCMIISRFVWALLNFAEFQLSSLNVSLEYGSSQ